MAYSYLKIILNKKLIRRFGGNLSDTRNLFNTIDKTSEYDLLQQYGEGTLEVALYKTKTKKIKGYIWKGIKMPKHSQVAAALEEWIKLHNEDMRNKQYLIIRDGESYTLNDLLNEIKSGSPFGRQIEKDILMLAVDLIARNKEKLGKHRK